MKAVKKKGVIIMKYDFKKLMCKLLTLCMILTIWQASATEVRAVEKIPISSIQDFINMENNPSGSYYLTKDITFPKEMKTLFPYDLLGKKLKFTGTLDGRGHKLKGFNYSGAGSGNYWEPVSLFGAAKNATFKNLSLTGVNVNINAGEGDAVVSTLVYDANGCKFDKVKVSGKITIKGNCTAKSGAHYEVMGLSNNNFKSTFTNCSSSLEIKVSAKMTNQLYISGLVEDAENLTNCSFKGSITADVKAAYEWVETDHGARSESGDFLAAGLCVSANEKVTGCTNSGNIKLNVNKGSVDKAHGEAVIVAYGIGGGRPKTMTSCNNSGTIKVSAPKMKSVVKAYGLVQEVYKMKKCWNKGGISVKGGASVGIAGLSEEISYADECYNKGKVTATGTKTSQSCLVNDVIEAGNAGSIAGGLSIRVSQMNNCYNVGSVTLKGRGGAAGLSYVVGAFDQVSKCNYSIGTITAKNGEAAALFYAIDTWEAIMHGKPIVYDSYYKGCKKGYCRGPSPTNKGVPRVTKISSVTSRSCPKLSAKYWKYSPKYKRLILKNNKEK